jgi:lipopolysaccharide/colanic/teichoic acid biosynthesis glycosyltransferase
VYRTVGKRLLDLFLTVVFGILLIPLLLALAFWLFSAQGPPLLFMHERVGLGGRRFYLFKFRTMVLGAEKLGPHFTVHGDARVTRLGSIFRRYSLDELPQLLNVLRGDLSLIGPRPDTPTQIEKLPAQQQFRRCSVRPGITGLAQVNGRSSLAPDRRLLLDLDYVERVSLALDLRILFRTFVQLIRPTGAW